MNIYLSRRNLAQGGMVLVSSLLLLIVVTIIALGMYRSFGIQEKIAGNVREKQRALQAAVTAETFAENWLQNNGAIAGAAPCATTLSANIGQMQICSNTLPTSVADVTDVSSWVGATTYKPLSMVIGAASMVPVTSTYYGTYVALPQFYISDMGPSIDPAYPGEVYQVDAGGYGGNTNTVAEVESTYVVYTTSHLL
jgi:type IV pilus assembly protein PilX